MSHKATEHEPLIEDDIRMLDSVDAGEEDDCQRNDVKEGEHGDDALATAQMTRAVRMTDDDITVESNDWHVKDAEKQGQVTGEQRIQTSLQEEEDKK